tara:strand:+ start:57 stop:362 length:306 start_codon:yes stop_codon:yes gene_type:complete
LFSVDEGDALVDQTFWEVFALFPFTEIWDASVTSLIGVEIVWGCPGLTSGDRPFEALIYRKESFAPEVPFARVAGRISSITKYFRNGDDAEVEGCFVIDRD